MFVAAFGYLDVGTRMLLYNAHIGVGVLYPKGCHLDVVRGPNTPHDPESR
jgi:hypothetical protein